MLFYVLKIAVMFRTQSVHKKLTSPDGVVYVYVCVDRGVCNYHAIIAWFPTRRLKHVRIFGVRIG